MDINKDINEIVQEGLREIDNEITQSQYIREQADEIVKDMLSNNNKTSYVYIGEDPYIFQYYKTDNERYYDDIDEQYKIGTTYSVLVTNEKLKNQIALENGIALENACKFKDIKDKAINGVISPRLYRPAKYEAPLRGLEIEQVLNTLVSTGLAYTLGVFDQFVVGEIK